MTETGSYTSGDWIVHPSYGIGQIRKIEIKHISGHDKRYFKIQTSNSLYWIPVEDISDELVRALSTPDDVEHALTVLQTAPTELSSNMKVRQNDIQRARAANTLSATAQIVRDLHALRKSTRTQGVIERTAYNALKQQLVEEWAFVMGLRPEQVLSQIDGLLNAH